MLDVWEGAGHEVPELDRVGLYRQVRKLMDDDVFDDLGREHHGAPAESEGAVGGTASPTAALAPDEHPSPLAHAYTRPPEVYPRSDVFGGLGTVPRGEGLQDALLAHISFESGAHGDLKLTLVEADLGRRSNSVLDNHLDVAAEVGEGLAGDEAPGSGSSGSSDILLTIHGARSSTMSRIASSVALAGAATRTPWGVSLISTVFLRRGLRRIS